MNKDVSEGVIYKIFNTVNEKFYIGQTRNFEKRINEHVWSLKKNKHYNKKLQRAWNKHGQENFRFSIVEQVPADDLNKVEQSYLDIGAPYNIAKSVLNPFMGVRYERKQSGWKKLALVSVCFNTGEIKEFGSKVEALKENSLEGRRIHLISNKLPNKTVLLAHERAWFIRSDVGEDFIQGLKNSKDRIIFLLKALNEEKIVLEKRFALNSPVRRTCVKTGKVCIFKKITATGSKKSNICGVKRSCLNPDISYKGFFWEYVFSPSLRYEARIRLKQESYNKNQTRQSIVMSNRKVKFTEVVRTDIVTGDRYTYDGLQSVKKDGFCSKSVWQFLDRAVPHRGFLWKRGKMACSTKCSVTHVVIATCVKTGEVIEYPSATIASNKFNCKVDAIRGACIYSRIKFGCTWHYRKGSLKRSKHIKGRSVLKINLETGQAHKYKSLKDAKKDGFRAEYIKPCCYGEVESYKGFAWKFGDLIEKKGHSKPILAKSLEDGAVTEYAGSAVVAKEFECNRNSVNYMCRNKNEKFGFAWSYKD